MFSQFRNTLKPAATLSLVLFTIFALSSTGAPAKSDGDQVTYSANEIIEFGCGTTIDVIDHGNKVIKIWVDSTALDDYMIEQGINQVNLKW